MPPQMNHVASFVSSSLEAMVKYFLLYWPCSRNPWKPCMGNRINLLNHRTDERTTPYSRPTVDQNTMGKVSRYKKEKKTFLVSDLLLSHTTTCSSLPPQHPFLLSHHQTATPVLLDALTAVHTSRVPTSLSIPSRSLP